MGCIGKTILEGKTPRYSYWVSELVCVPCRLMLTIMLSIFKESESEYNHVESESEEDKSGEAVWCNCRREDNDAS